MNQTNNLISKDGIGLNVQVDIQTVVLLAGSVFVAVTFGVIIGRIVTKNV